MRSETIQLACPACLIANRVPAARLGEDPKCGKCGAMAPQFERAARELKGRARLVKVNTEEAPGLASRMGIRAIPTIALFRNGAEVKRVSGALDAKQPGTVGAVMTRLLPALLL